MFITVSGQCLLLLPGRGYYTSKFLITISRLLFTTFNQCVKRHPDSVYYYFQQWLITTSSIYAIFSQFYFTIYSVIVLLHQCKIYYFPDNTYFHFSATFIIFHTVFTIHLYNYLSQCFIITSG